MRRVWAALLTALLIPACGGGGGGGAAFAPEVVFQADKDVDTRQEAYAASASGSTRLLSGVTAPGDSVRLLRVSADFSRVSFLADKDDDGVSELWVASASGGAPVKVSENDGEVRRVAWSPVGTMLAYSARPAGGQEELYVVSEGSPRVKVSGTLVAGGNVVSWQWRPGATRLLYAADQAVDNTFEIHTVLPSGMSNLKVSGSHPAPGTSQGAIWSPDGSHLAYTAEGQVWTAPGPAAGGHVSVSGPMVAGGVVDTGYGLIWAPNGARLAYVADQLTNNVFELFTAAKSVASSAVRVSGPIVAGGEIYDPLPGLAGEPVVHPIQWFQDCSFIFYLADHRVNDQVELFVADPIVDGSGDVISRPMAAGGDVFRFTPSPDSQWAAYVASETGTGPVELLTVQRGTGTVTPIAAPFVAGGGVDDFAWHPVLPTLLYSADREVAGSAELYRATPGVAAASVKISGPIVAGGGVSRFAWTSDAAAIYYMADQFVNGVEELFRVVPDGTGNVRVSGPLVTGGNVTTFDPLR